MKEHKTPEEQRQSDMQMRWIRNLMGGMSNRQFAMSLDIAERSFQSWMRREHIVVGGVLKIATKMNLDPVQALVDTGYLPENYGKRIVPEISTFSTEELVDELELRTSPEMGRAIRVLALG